MKRAISVFIAFMLIPLCSCSGLSIYSEFHEPDELIIISTVGIDYDDGKITVTAETGTGLDGTPPKIFSETADSLVEAIHDIQNGFITDFAYFAQADQIIIGREAAENCMDEITDYIARDVSMRIAANVFIVKDGTAKSLIENTAGEAVSATDLLEAMSQRSGTLEIGTVYSCKDIITGLLNGKNAMALAIEESPVIEISNEKEKASVLPAGVVLFDKSGLKTVFPKESIGSICLLCGELTTGLINIKAQDSEAVLKIMDIKIKPEAVYSETGIERLEITISSRMSLKEAERGIFLSDADTVRELEKSASDELAELAQAAVSYAQEERCEIFGIGKKLEMKDSGNFGKIKNDWDEIFSELAITIKGDVTLSGTYDIENALDIYGA